MARGGWKADPANADKAAAWNAANAQAIAKLNADALDPKLLPGIVYVGKLLEAYYESAGYKDICRELRRIGKQH